MNAKGRTFLDRTKDARKVMLLDIGLLGDTVHLLPALWNVRQAYPEAELHVAVAEHVTSVMQCAPWVDKVWGYPRFLRRTTFREDWQFITGLRREKLDVIINLSGSDRSNWLALLGGARARLVRGSRASNRHYWRHVFTDFVEYHYNLAEPIYSQRCRCLALAGFPDAPPEFKVEVGPGHLAATGIAPADAGTYFHVSPFTTDDVKELPPEQLAGLMAELARLFPEKRWVLSCSPTDRERRKLEALLALLPERPWRVFPGNLNLMQLSAIIQHSALHLCGDTGTLHLGLMTGARTVSWFRPRPGICPWMPAGPQHRAVIGKMQPGMERLCGVPTDELVQAAAAVLEARRENRWNTLSAA